MEILNTIKILDVIKLNKQMCIYKIEILQYE